MWASATVPRLPPAGPGTTAGAAHRTAAPARAAAPQSAAPHRRRLRRQPPRQRRHARRLEQAADRQLHTEARPNPADQPHRQQRMTAKLEEVVVETHTPDPQHLGKQRAQHRLRGRPRRRCPPSRTAPPAQAAPGGRACRSASAAAAPAPRMRTAPCSPAAQQTAPHEAAPRPARPPPPAPRSPPGAGRRRRASVARHHRSRRHSRLPKQHRLDLARLDPEPAKLHLRVRTPQELQHPVRAPPRQVPGPVHPRSRRTVRVGDEPLRRQTRAVQITPRKTKPRDVKLAHHAHTALAQDRRPAHTSACSRSGDRSAPRARCPRPQAQRVTSIVGLGRAVEVLERTRGSSRAPVPQARRQRLAAADQTPHRGRSAAPLSARDDVLDKRRQHRRHECSVVTASRCDRCQSRAGITVRAGDATTSRAPTSSGQKNSHTDTSKPNGVFCSTASSAASP